MKIVDRKTFLEQSAGTLFAKFEPNAFYDLCIKGESLLIAGSSNDFYYQPIVDSIRCKDSNEFEELCDASWTDDKDIEMDFSCENRDGFYDEQQMFAIWSTKDVQQLINRLQQAINR